MVESPASNEGLFAANLFNYAKLPDQ